MVVFLSSQQSTWAFVIPNRKSAFLTVLTQATLGWPDRSTYPNGQWSKGHITTTLSKFFSHWCSKTNLASMPQSELLVLCVEANEHISCCMKQLYEHDVWIPVNTSRAIALEGLKFLDCHHRLALKAHRQSLAYFIYMPKIHIMDHIFQQMYEDSFLPQVTWVMNPLVCAVQVDEDYVGRTSRLARRAGPLQVVTRVLQRSLQASYKHWHDAKYIRLKERCIKRTIVASWVGSGVAKTCFMWQIPTCLYIIQWLLGHQLLLQGSPDLRAKSQKFQTSCFSQKHRVFSRTYKFFDSGISRYTKPG